MTVPSSLVVIVPSPSLSNSENASLNSAICSSVSWSAITLQKTKQHACNQSESFPGIMNHSVEESTVKDVLSLPRSGETVEVSLTQLSLSDWRLSGDRIPYFYHPVSGSITWSFAEVLQRSTVADLLSQKLLCPLVVKPGIISIPVFADVNCDPSEIVGSISPGDLVLVLREGLAPVPIVYGGEIGWVMKSCDFCEISGSVRMVEAIKRLAGWEVGDFGILLEISDSRAKVRKSTGLDIWVNLWDSKGCSLFRVSEWLTVSEPIINVESPPIPQTVIASVIPAIPNAPVPCEHGNFFSWRVVEKKSGFHFFNYMTSEILESFEDLLIRGEWSLALICQKDVKLRRSPEGEIFYFFDLGLPVVVACSEFEDDWLRVFVPGGGNFGWLKRSEIRKIEFPISMRPLFNWLNLGDNHNIILEIKGTRGRLKNGEWLEIIDSNGYPILKEVILSRKQSVHDDMVQIVEISELPQSSGGNSVESEWESFVPSESTQLTSAVSFDERIQVLHHHPPYSLNITDYWLFGKSGGRNYWHSQFLGEIFFTRPEIPFPAVSVEFEFPSLSKLQESSSLGNIAKNLLEETLLNNNVEFFKILEPEILNQNQDLVIILKVLSVDVNSKTIFEYLEEIGDNSEFLDELKSRIYAGCLTLPGLDRKFVIGRVNVKEIVLPYDTEIGTPPLRESVVSNFLDSVRLAEKIKIINLAFKKELNDSFWVHHFVSLPLDHLEYLNLWNSGISDSGGMAIGGVLGKMSRLKYLNLEGNYISDNGSAAIFNGLENNSYLKMLFFSTNRYSSLSVLSFIRSPRFIEICHLSLCGFDDFCASLMVEKISCAESFELLSLDIEGDISKEGVELLVGEIEKSETVKYLKIRGANYSLQRRTNGQYIDVTG